MNKFRDYSLIVLIASDSNKDVGYSISYDEFKDVAGNRSSVKSDTIYYY